MALPYICLIGISNPKGYGVGLKTGIGPWGGTPLQEPNGDVLLDGVAFSQLE